MAYKDKKQALYAVVSRRLTALEKGGDRGELANIRRYGFDGKAYETTPMSWENQLRVVGKPRQSIRQSPCTRKPQEETILR